MYCESIAAYCWLVMMPSVLREVKSRYPNFIHHPGFIYSLIDLFL